MAQQEVNRKFVDRIQAKFRKWLLGPGERTTSELIPTNTMFGLPTVVRNWYRGILKPAEERRAKYKLYDFLDKNLPEAETALSVYADNVVSGKAGGDETYNVVIDESYANIDQVEEIITDLENRMRLKDDVWDIVRDFIKNGDVFEEVVVAKEGDKYFIQKLKDLPEDQMWINHDEFGRINEEFPYIQKADPYSDEGIEFEDWRIIHFKMGRRMYGVDRSLFANSSNRVGRQLLMVYEAMVISRLQRAPQRYAWNVDTTGMQEADKFAYLEKFEERVKRKKMVDPETGRLNIYDNPLWPDDDVFVPVDKDSTTQGIQVLSGDLNIGNIVDVEYLQDLFFMGVQFPKVYAAKEGDVRGKATITQIDVQFARQVRRRQYAMVPGLRKIYATEMILNGIDPESFTWDIVFPELGTIDEMIKWEIEKLKADVAKIYMVDIQALNNDWLYKEVLGLTQEEIDDYGLFLPPPEGGGEFTLPAEMARRVKQDPTLRWILNDLKDVLDARKARSDMIANKRVVGVKRRKE